MPSVLDTLLRVGARRLTLATVVIATLVGGTGLTLWTRSRDDPCPPSRALPPVRAQLAQLLLVGVAHEAAARRVLGGEAPVGGLLLLAAEDPWYDNGRLRKLASRTQPAPFVAVDEEGGPVQRLAARTGRIPAARAVALAMTPNEATALARSHGRLLRRLGVTTVLAPVADLYDPGNPIIGDRAFSSDPAVAAGYVSATAEGIRQAGLMPVLKHFPGGGRAAADPHLAPAQTPDIASLRAADLLPFRSLGRSDGAVMIGHLDVPDLTEPDRPASLSGRAINGLLRNELGFEGLVLTDDLTAMAAVTSRFSLRAAVIEAIGAGADVVTLSEIDQPQLEGLLDALTVRSQDDPAFRTAVSAASQRLSQARATYRIC